MSVWSKFQEAVQTRDDAALELVAGACPPLDRPRGYEQIAFEEECGKAYHVFDKCVKNYLVRCWRARGARIGTVRWLVGFYLTSLRWHLFLSPSDGTGASDCG